MISIVKKTLETYLRDKRVVTRADLSSEDIVFESKKDAIFVTLYLDNKIIASRGRIQCQKENSLQECIDLTLQCLKDSRFSQELQNLDSLAKIKIRVDSFGSADRRILKNIAELDTKTEGLIFLSQELGKMSVLLPNIVANTTAEVLLQIAQAKVGIETPLPQEKFIIYALKTQVFTDL